MPHAAAAAVTGFNTLAAAFAAGAGAAAAYLHAIATTADFDLLPASLDMQVVCDEIATAHHRGELRAQTHEGYDDSERLIGPIVAVGHCMEALGHPPGSIGFFDPALPIRGGDTVLVANRGSTAARTGVFDFGRVHAGKVIDHLCGRWWLRGSDGIAPVEIGSGITVLGRLVLTLRLPATSVVSQYALRESCKLESSVPVEFTERSNEASDALATRTTIDRTPYPWKQMVGPLFWRNVGLPSVDAATLRADLA